MRLKKIYIIILAIIITGGGFFGFFISNGPGDKTTVIDYINNGGFINSPASDNSGWTGETDVTPVWTSGTNFPSPGRYHGSGVSFTRNDTSWLYCFGGREYWTDINIDTVKIYNITTNTWSTGALMPPTVVLYHSAARLGSIAYVVGGIGQDGAFASEVNEVKRYNITSNTWLTNAANYPTTVADGKAAGYQDSLIYVVGGLVNGTSSGTAKVNLYNANTNTWRIATPLPVARSGGAMAITGDTIVYVCGGLGYSSGLSNSVYRGVISQSDRSVITWTTGTNYPGTSRHRFDAAPWGCQGIIISPGSTSGFSSSNTVYRYSPGANIWTAMPNSPNVTAIPFIGSSVRTGNIWKLVMASGGLPHPNQQVQILTDTLCPFIQQPLCEQFAGTTFPPSGWRLIFAGAQYWVRRAVSGFGIGTGSAVYLMWFASVGTNQTLETLTFAPSSACPGGVLDSLIIDFAYSPYQTAQDSLIIFSSTNSGTTYTSLRRLGPLELQTTAPQTTEFTPTASQWVKRSFALPVGTNKIQFLGKSQFGNNLYLDSICIKTCLVGITPISLTPAEYYLSQNYPNPFNPSTNIKFSLPKSGFVKLTVFDILGREAAILVNEFKNAGQYSVDFNASQLASGIYFYRIEAGDYKDTKKMLMIK